MEGEKCPCCHEPIENAPSLRHATGRTRLQVNTEVARGVACNHAFHVDCLSRWAITCMAKGAPPTCPMCRGDVLPVLEEYDVIKRSPRSGATRVCASMIARHVEYHDFAMPDTSMPSSAENHAHPFLLALNAKHHREVTRGWPLQRRMHLRFAFKLDVLRGPLGTVTIIVPLYHVMGIPMFGDVSVVFFPRTLSSPHLTLRATAVLGEGELVLVTPADSAEQKRETTRRLIAMSLEALADVDAMRKMHAVDLSCRETILDGQYHLDVSLGAESARRITGAVRDPATARVVEQLVGRF